MRTLFVRIIDAGAEELAELRDKFPASETSVNAEVFETNGSMASEIGTDVARDYLHVILHFMRADFTEMERIVGNLSVKAAADSAYEPCYRLSLLRLRIRQRLIDRDLLPQAAELSAANRWWGGEAALLVGTAFTVLEDYVLAKHWFQVAAGQLESIGANRKALKARLNLVAAQDYLGGNCNLIAEFHDLYRRAMRRNTSELSVAATCLHNISREYQKLGAINAAISYCEKALSLLQPQLGSIAYYLTLAHRAHLYFESGRIQEARLDVEFAMAAPFPEVKAALKILRARLKSLPLPVDLSGEPLLPTWRERACEAAGEFKTRKLSALETDLVRLLGAKPRARSEIVDMLYGSALDFDVRLNRFNSLLAALRKKRPGLVICQRGTYRLALPGRACARGQGRL